MNITLITEGTYPHNLGGVSVWCDQLVRNVEEHSFSIMPLCATGAERVIWPMPANVVAVNPIPLWAPTPQRRASRSLCTLFRPVLGRFLQSLSIGNVGPDFVETLVELAEWVGDGQLQAAMCTQDAVEQLLAAPPRCSERLGSDSANQLSVADAVDILLLLEHSLRPLAVMSPSVDIYHSVANGLGILPALIAKRTRNTPFLLTEHGIYLRERYLSYAPGTHSQAARTVIIRFFRLLAQAGYDNADVVAPCSHYNGLWELANGTPAERIRPVYNGVYHEQLPEALTEPDVPTLSWVGRIDPLKDVETLLRAFAIVRQSVPDCRLRIFGPVPEGGEEYAYRCQSLASQLDLGTAVTFEGSVKPPPVEAYHAGHVVVLTSISESLPYTVLEAMATGRPVVATNVGGVAEAIGDAGLLVPPRHPAAVAEACVRLLTDPQERAAIGAAARKRVLEQFTVGRCFGTYRQIYQQLAATEQDVIELPEPVIVLQPDNDDKVLA